MEYRSEENKNVCNEKQKVLIATLGGGWVGFEVTDIIEVLKVGKSAYVPTSPPFVEGITHLRGDVVTIIKIEKIINAKIFPKTEDAHVIIINKNDMLLGVTVNKVDGIYGFSPEEFSKPYAKENASLWSGIVRRKKNVVNLLDTGKLCTFLDTYNYAHKTTEPSSKVKIGMRI